ncbi:hypothetical protein ACFC58_36425 [Kitasatospora purpeofusca]|uniref:hypothetical protein n=1 Tax=Kitasatospora purpeofusca TaxID=67352 RepID=UPI0035E20EB1
MTRPEEITPVLVLLTAGPLIGVAVRCWVHPDEVRRRAHRRRLRAARRHNESKRRA